MELLDAIAIMNGGVSATILHGDVDYASQMQSFFESEFGTNHFDEATSTSWRLSSLWDGRPPN
jgi:hypothetical protein